MNEVESEQQINQMISFILNEATNTASAIQQKADEDFNIEKLKLVQSMKEKLRTDGEKSRKQLETKAMIERSTMINRARLKKIEWRQQCMNKLEFETRAALAVSTNDASYKKIMVDLIVQGAIKLMEDNIVVRCRAQDVNMVKGILGPATQTFAQTLQSGVGISGSEVRFTLDSENLPKDCLGGVVLLCQNNTISVDNTLDTRLRLVLENDLPSLRKIVFPGSSAN